MPIRRPAHPWIPIVAALALAGAIGSALAEQGDRSKPMVVEADRPGTVDLQRQVVVFNGNVVISQGSMVLRADRVETRELPDGYRAATALGSPGHPATWRQRREGLDETVEGSADRIDFDGRANTLRLTGGSEVRRLRGGLVSDEITGGTILWDDTAQTFKVEGGAVTATNPGGRVRAVLSPRAEGPASAPAASAPGSAPAGAAALVPSRTIAPPR